MNRTYEAARTHHGARAAAGLVLSAATVAASVAAGTPAMAATNHTVIAHRGDRSAAPENTLAAFGSAIRKGAEVIELDVQFSRTGYPVVIHDATLDRTTDCTGKVSSKSVSQLHKCDAGSWFGKAFKGEEIPTLWDALKYIHEKSSTTKVILHMKVTPTKDQAKITMQRVTKNKMLDRTIVMASTTTAMSRMKNAGAKKRAWIFNSPSGWDHKYQTMVPYDTKVDAKEVAAAKKRGAVVWTVEGHPLTATSLLGLDTPVQGVMLNHLTSSLIDSLNGLVKVVTKPLEAVPLVPAPAPLAPKSLDADSVQTKSFESNRAEDESIRKAAVGGADDETSSPPGG